MGFVLGHEWGAPLPCEVKTRPVFLPRISFNDSESYMRAAQAGLLRPGQWIEFEGIKGRFARCNNGGNVVTFYWSTGAKKSALGYLKAHGKRATLAN
jgi:hypothetical protein